MAFVVVAVGFLVASGLWLAYRVHWEKTRWAVFVEDTATPVRTARDKPKITTAGFLALLSMDAETVLWWFPDGPADECRHYRILSTDCNWSMQQMTEAAPNSAG